MEKRYTDPPVAAQVLLAQGLLGAVGASDAAKVNPILAGGGGIEDIIPQTVAPRPHDRPGHCTG